MTKRILVVDDIADLRNLITFNLKQLGLGGDVEQASNAQDALQKLDKKCFDAVISDWNMPVMTGIDFLRAIRAHPIHKDLPFLLVTAEGHKSLVTQAIEAGVSEFLVKPFSLAALERKIASIFGVDGFRLSDKVSEPSTVAATTALTNTPEIETRGRVLIVDDTPDNLTFLSALLKDDYQIKVANSGERALKIIESGTPPDLILLDIMMPKMDGLEVCRYLKQNPATRDIPVIFVTAKAEADDVIKGLEMGGVDYITKPVNPLVLKARVSSHMRLYRAQKTLAMQAETLRENLQLREEVERISQHDLKNPLGAIVNLTGILNSDASLSDAQKEMIKMIDEAAYSALHMVNLTHSIHKMETGTFELSLSQVDLAALLQRLLRERRHEAESRQIDLRIESAEENFTALGDELLCYSMCGNLLKNALEASPDQVPITISLYKTDKTIELAIHNYGPIPLDIRPRFFQKYATCGKVDGTGLGAYSAKLMALAQGGSIQADSSEPDCTRITVALPVARA